MNIADTIRGVVRNWLNKGHGAARWSNALVPAWRDGRPAAWADDPHEQVRHYKHWVYAAVNAIAFRVASTEMTLYARRGPVDAEKVADHPVLSLFNYVNDFDTRFRLWCQTMTFLELTGNAYWYIPNDGLGAPAEIWVVHSQHMKVVPDRDRFIRGYVYRESHPDEIRFDPSEIIHFKYPNPVDSFYGTGPLQAAAASVDAHEARATAHWNMMRRGIYAGAAFSTDKELRKPDIALIEEQVKQKYASPDKAGRPIILHKGLHGQRIDFAPREMALLESASITRDEILSIFGVPAAVVGISEDVARAAADAMDVIFARYCIAPRLQMIAAQLNQDLLPRYDARLFVRFDNVVPEDEQKKRAINREDFRAGLLTRNEARAAVGLDAVPDGDRFCADGKSAGQDS